MGKGEELYRRYRSGEESGFDGLIELYRENLIFFLLRYLPSIEDAEDAAEDAFVDLLLHPYREGRGSSLKTYLFTLGRNRALNLLKKQKRQDAFREAPFCPWKRIWPWRTGCAGTKSTEACFGPWILLPPNTGKRCIFNILRSFLWRKPPV